MWSLYIKEKEKQKLWLNNVRKRLNRDESDYRVETEVYTNLTVK